MLQSAGVVILYLMLQLYANVKKKEYDSSVASATVLGSRKTESVKALTCNFAFFDQNKSKHLVAPLYNDIC